MSVFSRPFSLFFLALPLPCYLLLDQRGKFPLRISGQDRGVLLPDSRNNFLFPSGTTRPPPFLLPFFFFFGLPWCPNELLREAERSIILRHRSFLSRYWNLPVSFLFRSRCGSSTPFFFPSLFPASHLTVTLIDEPLTARSNKDFL